MTDFAYWQSQMAPGTFMCMQCFSGLPIAMAWVDEEGQAWDVCQPCKEYEDQAIAQRKEGGPSGVG